MAQLSKQGETHPSMTCSGYAGRMILAALVLGVFTAYYFGLKLGAIACGGALALFILGLLMPTSISWIYGTICLFTIGVALIGPRLPTHKHHKADFFRILRRGVSEALKISRRLKK